MIRRVYRLWPDPTLLGRLWLLTAVLAVLQGLLLGLLVPILRALLRPEPDLAAAAPWLIAGGVGVLGYGALSLLATPIGLDACVRLAIQLRHRLMDHATTLPLGWFTAERRGELVHTVTAVTHHLAGLPFTVGAPAITGVLVPLTVSGVVFTLDWRLGLLLLAFVAPALLTLRRLRRVTAEVSVDMEIAGKEVVRRILEYGQAQPVLRASGHAGTGTPRMRAALLDHERRSRRGLVRMLPIELGFNALVAGVFVASLVLIVVCLLGGAHPIADTVVLLVLAVRYAEPLAGLYGHCAGLGAMDYLAGQVEDVLATPGLPTRPDPVRRIPGAGITFDRVSFGYGGSRPVLRQVSLHCRPGTTTALVGPSGAGKTSVIRLAARFFDVDDGRVLVGGMDVRDLDPDALLEEIAIVFQDVYLFDTTIEDNVRLARPHATAAELDAATRAARLDEVIGRLPDGWQTRVGEAGAQLSGGERQRVSIARAFLKQARIVLIDEAASALDPENERAVADAIGELARDPDRSVLVVAHRPATLAAADQVVVLDAGRVVESGAPSELRAAGGVFSRLHDQYDRARGWRISTRA